ncbi:DDE-type integrase/transposase/recombinase [Bacillus sp. AC79A.1]|uniref:DDE-type integrase/transposase/recombinase n=1 Tax=Bacillus wiedmannii TaxID=1890302 RepID=UPI0034CD9402
MDVFISYCRFRREHHRFLEINKQPSAFSYVSKPRVITVDKNPAYPVAMQELKEESHMPEGIPLRQVRYINNIVKQDHRFIKKRVRSMLGLKSYKTVTSILSDVEAMHMIKKGQIDLQNLVLPRQVDSCKKRLCSH